MSYQVVFFDAGQTLFYPHPSVGEIYCEIAEKHGVQLQSDSLNRRFFEVWKNKNKLKPDPTKEDKAWWKEIVRRVVPTASFKDFDKFFEELYFDFASPKRWKLYQDVLPVLDYLLQKKIPMLIVSNWDSRLRHICQFYNLNQYFDDLIISAEVGVAKPNKKIFEIAMKKMTKKKAHLKPSEIIHIGDSLLDDVEGAKRIGITPVYLNRRGNKTEWESFDQVIKRNHFH